MGDVLVIDQSTSGTKAIVFDMQGNPRAQGYSPHEQIYPRPGWVEHDAEEIYRNTCSVIRGMTTNSSAEIQFLSITNQRETIVIFDKATGAPLHNAIVWQCRRGEAICAALEADGHGELVTAKTGLKLDTYFPASKIKWLFDHHPAIHAKVLAGDALIGTIDTYLIYRLTGGRVFATDPTNASRTLLFDIHTRQWDAELCALFGVPRHALPEVRDCDADFGVAEQWSLPICGVMGDSQAALLAQRCFTAGSTKVTFGTGSSVMLNCGATPLQGGDGIVTALAWVIGGEPTYALEGITNFTGGTIGWLRDQLGIIETAAETATLAAELDDNGGVYLVPAFVGLSAPYWRPNARATIVGLTPASDRRHIARAALEAIAFRIRDVLDVMARVADVPLRQIHADGGATRNHFLMQSVADITQIDVLAAQTAELSALGAVYAGMIGRGIVADLAALDTLPREQARFAVAISAENANKLYAGWQRAVRQTLAT